MTTSPRRAAERDWRAYAQLMRVPAVFTAMANVAMGFLFTHGNLQPWPVFLLLWLASSCLYLVGHGAQRRVRRARSMPASGRNGRSPRVASPGPSPPDWVSGCF